MATSKGGRRAQQQQQEEIQLMAPADVSVFREIFEPYEAEGGIPLREVLERVLTLCTNRHEELPQDVQQRIIDRADRDRDGRLDYNEFVRLMTVQRPDLQAIPLTKFQKVVRTAVSSVVPRGAKRGDGETDFVESYTEHYNCCPPPLFIVIISAAELIIFIAYVILNSNDENRLPGSSVADAPRYSPLIYQPPRRYEAWRYLTYMFIHDGYKHIISNLIFQLVLGIPLEIVHKYWRVGTVYCLGVITGSLATSMTDSWTLLCGASGGCYSLIGAHFATIIMNWKDMTHEWMSGPIKFICSAPVQLTFWTLYMIIDTGVAIYMRYFAPEPSRVAYVAHFAGFLGGMLVGIPVLKNFKKYDWERVVFWVALVTYIVFVLIAICFNIFYTANYPPTDWRACCPAPCYSYPHC